MTRDEVVAALEALAATGPVTPSRLVAAAKNRSHPLHDRFEWDDAKAAHEHRLATARHIINVTVLHIPDKPPIRMYVHVPDQGGEGEYVHVQTLVHQPERWQLARDQVIRYLKAAMDSLEGLDEAMRIFGKPKAQNVKKSATAKKSIARAHDTISSISP